MKIENEISCSTYKHNLMYSNVTCIDVFTLGNCFKLEYRATALIFLKQKRFFAVNVQVGRCFYEKKL